MGDVGCGGVGEKGEGSATVSGCLACNWLQWGGMGEVGVGLLGLSTVCLTQSREMGVSQRMNCLRCLHFSGSVPCASEAASFTSLFVSLTLSPSASYPLPGAPLAQAGSDDSSRICMKVTQGNKGPAVPEGGGGGERTQEFQASAWNSGCLLSCVGLLDPQRTRHDASGSGSSLIPSAPRNSVSPLICCFRAMGSQLRLTFLP